MIDNPYECAHCNGFGVYDTGNPCGACNGTGLEPVTLDQAIEEQHCEHAGFSAQQYRADPFDDHVTMYGHCPDCDTWLVATEWYTGKVTEFTPMTDFQRQRLGMSETRRERSEWLADHAGGAS